ncbi:MAG TPA: hypothetical protein VFQ38_10060 [Longimicrobiales bacterium]|nr:hypothetical protein [Longimicrobiales bacterium]
MANDSRHTPEPRMNPAPATGTTDPRLTEMAAEEEPVTTGTLFLMLVFLMMIAGFWGLMYVTLLQR